MAHAIRRGYTRDTAAGERPPASRTRVAAARGAWAVGSVCVAIARLIRLIVGVAAIIIVAAIVLRIASANMGNVIVRDIHDVGKVLVGPFKNIFSIKNAKADLAANWGLAAIVWLIVGGVIAGLIARIAPTGVHPSRPVA